MNTESVKIGTGYFDKGAWHRAIDVARHLEQAGIWDGQQQLTINDAYTAHGKIACSWGAGLVAGVDYELPASAPMGGGSADAAIVFDDIIDAAPYRELSDYPGTPVTWKRGGKAYSGTILQADPDGDVMWLYIQYATLAGLGVIVSETWLTEECVTFVNQQQTATPVCTSIAAH